MFEIKLGFGFESEEKILAYYYSGIPIDYDHINEEIKAINKFLIVTNTRIIFCNKPEFDIIDVNWIKFKDILGVRIENKVVGNCLVFYSKLKKRGKNLSYNFAFFGQVNGFFGEIIKHNPYGYQTLIDIKDYILKLKENDVIPNTITKTKRINIPQKIRNEVWRRDERKCVECGSKENLEFDHVIPISKGGSNTARNLQLLCEKCNRTKSDKI